MKKILCHNEPVISCYPEYGFLFSFIEDVNAPWFVNQFIELELIPEWECFISYKNHSQLLRKCPYIKDHVAMRSDLNRKNIDIVEFAVENITKDTCLFVFLDYYYIGQLPEYQKKHYIHNSFVVGCDTDKEVIYLADNFFNGKYLIIECSYENFRSAFQRDADRTVQDNVLQEQYQNNVIEYIADLVEQYGEAYVFAERMDISGLETYYPTAHNLKIVGYDPDHKKIILEDHEVKDPTVVCSFEEMQKAYRRDPKQEHMDEIQILEKIVPGEKQIINVDTLIGSLENYLSPVHGESIRDGYKIIYNIKALEFIINNGEDNLGYRYRVLQFLYEHKILMERRVVQLTKEGFLEKENDLISRFAKLRKEYLLFRNVIIKSM